MVKTKGFTLIELMVVIAIVGIVVSMFVGPRRGGNSYEAPPPATTDASEMVINGVVHTCNDFGECTRK